MVEASPEQRSIEQLKAEAVFENFISEEIDPHHKNIEGRLGQNEIRTQIIDRIKSTPEIWSSIQKRIPEGEFLTDFEEGNLYCDILVEIHNSIPSFFITLIDKAWRESRVKEIDFAFPREESHKTGQHSQVFDPRRVAERRRVAKVETIQALREFDPNPVEDRLGAKIDPNIIELVRYLNMTGLKTSASCGGHRSRNRQPYLDFSVENLSDLDSLLAQILLLKEACGFDWDIVRLGDYLPEVRLIPPVDKSLEASKADLRELTDFLQKELRFPMRKLSIAELTYRFHRKLKFA